MATTRIWKVQNNLLRVVNYAKDETKTENPKWNEEQYQALQDVMDYAMDDFKTEKQYYVTALNCSIDYARTQMQMTKKQFGKEDKILAWHGYQSFAENEVDADTVHKIGVKLAQKLWPKYQVIVATHLNTKCFHNHFVLNSVSFLDGKKFNACKESYRKMRAESDRLCKEYGLSIITEHKAYYPKHYAEWDATQKGQPTWRSAIRVDVDAALRNSMTWTSFLRNLQGRGYEIKYGKHIAIRPPGKERFVRLRSLGENYTEEKIRERILRKRSSDFYPTINEERIISLKRSEDFRLSKVTWKGLRALYFFYLRKLHQAQKNPESASFLIRDDLRKLDKISEQTIFLFKNKIDTIEQLKGLIENVKIKIEGESKEKDMLIRKKKTLAPQHTNDIDNQIKKLNKKIKQLYETLDLSYNILENSLAIETNLKSEQRNLQSTLTARNKKRHARKTCLGEKAP